MPILLYPPAYCGLESFCRHPMTSGALGDWQAVNLFNFVNLLQPRYCTIHHPILTGVVIAVVIGLRNKTALSVILCKSVISRPNRNLQKLFIRHLGRITYFFQIFKVQRILSFMHYKICGLIRPQAVSDSVNRYSQ